MRAIAGAILIYSGVSLYPTAVHDDVAYHNGAGVLVVALLAIGVGLIVLDIVNQPPGKPRDE